MEITANIVEVSQNSIRVRTVSKKQEIDIFFTPSKAAAIAELYEPHMVTRINVEVETAHIEGMKLAKLWIRHVITPELPKLETLTGVQKDRYKKLLPLYKQPAQK